ncbi:MAG: hypothetical protein KAW12_12285 [Candidatus Aminicenantes bacterium]|nr:hypothetical protein [Candidatus Aminicenantes bacterium]
MKFIVLSSSKELIDSIERYLKYVHSITGVERFLVHNPGGDAYENFLVVKDWIEDLFKNNTCSTKDTMAFVDLPVFDLQELKPTADKSHGLTSLLYLSFPEIYWFFLTPFPNPQTAGNKGKIFNREAFTFFHTLSGQKNFSLENAVESLLYGYVPLFDPTGFRSYMIHNTLEQMEQENETNPGASPSRPFFRERKEIALSLDEESPYSFLHSYIAYKFDFRAMTVTTKKMLDKLKSEEQPEIGPGLKFAISFEDIGLSFPDDAIEYNKLKHSLETRDEKYSFIKKIKKRIFVTIGEERDLRKENRAYRKSLKRDLTLKFYKVLFKPYSGIFNLKKEAALRRGKNMKPHTTGTTGSHSQPGRLGLVADALINRSRVILKEAKCTIDAVYAAMLALQAQEILGGRTATESIKAISLKHQAEVLAECIFYGVEHNFDVKSRFKEIEEDLHTIGKWFTKSKKEIMIYNSELNIVNELARIFRQYSQFDEEQECLDKVRTLNRKIYRKRNKFWGWLVTPLRWYFEKLIGSLPRFLSAIALWPALFTLLYYFLLPSSGSVSRICNAFTCAVNSFFALQVTTVGEVPGVPALSILATLLGFFHLGIFISHLYTLVSRR